MRTHQEATDGLCTRCTERQRIFLCLIWNLCNKSTVLDQYSTAFSTKVQPMKSRIFSLLIVCLLLVCRSNATSIDVGVHNLNADMPGQIIRIDISTALSGTVTVAQGVNFNIQVADGGLDAGGSIPGPKITRIDILGGTLGGSTIFTGNNIGQTDTLRLPQIWESTTTTGSGIVTPNGVLGFVEIDTTGFFNGQMFDLIMSNTVNYPTDLAGIPVDVRVDRMLVQRCGDDAIFGPHRRRS